jgi:cobalt-zinc-cadmium efflux system outer membrane protein
MLGLFPATSSQAATKTELKAGGYSLDAILKLAFERNPRMDIGKGIIEERKGQQSIAAAYPNPELDTWFGYSEFRDSLVTIVTIERFVTVSQPLEWNPKRDARKRVASLGLEGAQASLEEIKVNLKSDVKEAFYTLLFAEKRVKLAEKNLAIVEGLLRRVRTRVQAGDAPPFEEVRVNVELMKVRKEVVRARGAVRAARATLNTLTAGALGFKYFLVGDFAKWPKGLELDALTAHTLDQHPALKKIQKFVEKAAHSHIHEKAARVPNLTVSGSYQRDAGREAYIGGLRVPLPIWYLREGEIAQALATQRQFEGHLLRMQNALIRDVNRNFQLSSTAAGQINTYQEGLLKQARESVRIARVSFKYGETSLLQVIDAQRVYWDTLIGYAQVRLDLSIALTKLERSLGRVPWMDEGPSS